MSIYGSSLYKEDKTWIKLLIFEPSSGGNYLSEVLSLYIGFHSIARSKSKERKLRMSIPSTFLYLVGVLFHTVHLKVSWPTQNLIKMRKGSYFLCPKCMHLVWAQGKAIWVFCWPRAVCSGSGDRQAGNILSKMFQCLTPSLGWGGALTYRDGGGGGEEEGLSLTNSRIRI